MRTIGDFPGGPVVKMPNFHWQGKDSISSREIKTLYITLWGQKKGEL